MSQQHNTSGGTVYVKRQFATDDRYIVVLNLPVTAKVLTFFEVERSQHHM
jgi:hypothetical protein